ncbi:hypothetical protein MUG91_G72n245 [Manis pentadactyla]|nr:hypothetical protein MUG91_G72n245 [Manis pentadactyla]
MADMLPPVITGKSQVASGSCHKRGESPDGCPCRRHTDNGEGDEKVRSRPSPAQGTGDDKPGSTRAGHHGEAGSAQSPWRREESRTPPRSSVTTTDWRCCQDRREARPICPKLCRHLSPEARATIAGITSRLFNHMNALEVALRELRSPGGAYLPVPARGTEPTASQRAWLTWQLTHAGAALQWAVAALDTQLCAQRWPAAPPAGGPATLAGAHPANAVWFLWVQSVLHCSQSPLRGQLLGKSWGGTVHARATSCPPCLDRRPPVRDTVSGTDQSSALPGSSSGKSVHVSRRSL